MKKAKNLPGYLFAILVMISIMTNGCKKEEDSEIVTDIDGNEYKTTKIGTQVWMKENLKTTRFSDGTPIPKVTDYTEWFDLNTPGFCWYDNDEDANKEAFGALYNWFAVETGKLCPSGWHVPSDDEWQSLALFIDPDAEAGFAESPAGGGVLKEKGTTHWSAPNEGATNKYGFSALPGGCRLDFNDVNFYGINEFGFWWSSTEYDDTRTWIMDMGYSYSILYRYRSYKIDGFSVRCVKD